MSLTAWVKNVNGITVILVTAATLNINRNIKEVIFSVTTKITKSNSCNSIRNSGMYSKSNRGNRNK